MGFGSHEGQEPCAGDHLVISRGSYTHHGIYLGAGRVAHKVAGTAVMGVALSSADASVRTGSGGVVLTTLQGFCPEAMAPDDWSRVGVVRYAECFAPEDTVALAVAAAARHAPYRLLESNCEHFASWCKVGEAVSLQVLAVRGALQRFGALTAGLLAGTAVLARLEVAERTVTRITHRRGRGLRGALGLGRTRTVVHETTVAEREVLLGAALVGIAAAAAAGAVARLQSAIAAQRCFRLACHVGKDKPSTYTAAPQEDVAAGGGSLGSFSAVSAASAASTSAAVGALVSAAEAAAVEVVVLKRRVVASGGLAALRKQLGGTGQLLVWRAQRAAWEPLADTAQLPRCASLRLAAA